MPRSTAGRPPLDLSVGEVARRAGVAVSAIHFYEAEGLIQGWRTSANHRRYPRGVLRRIAIIKVAQRAGISLKEIGEAFATLPAGAVPSARDWARFSAGWKSALDARIDRLRRLRDQLGSCIGCGCLSLADCPLRNPDDVLADDGPGARILDPTA
jgi:MerR family redox-sensitive transcriptional activator SoxR